MTKHEKCHFCTLCYNTLSWRNNDITFFTTILHFLKIVKSDFVMIDMLRHIPYM